MNYDDLSAEQKDRLAKCRTPEEVFELSKSEGYDLSDEEHEQIAGGWGSTVKCPKCGSTSNHKGTGGLRVCYDCGHSW